MKKLTSLFSLIIASIAIYAQDINPNNIQIIRDKWGVPHIYAKTDAEVAYGMAWANAEDDFYTMQDLLLASKGLLGSIKGKDYVPLDAIAHLTGISALVDTGYKETTFSPTYRKVFLGYLQGLNAYAAKHSKEVFISKVFPVQEKDLVKAYMLGYLFTTNFPREFGKIYRGNLDNSNLFGRNNDGTKASKLNAIDGQGSNAFAVASKKTTDGKTYLVINPHQPVDGPFAFHEVHLNSEEGWNILGGVMPLGCGVALGTNTNLGWAHTNNHIDFIDTYELKMNQKKKLQYEFDGKWETLQERPIKLKIKIGKVVVSKKVMAYWSKYGPTMQHKGHFFSIRTGAIMQMNACEQHYWMSKAKNFDEFKKALRMQCLPSLNVTYADKDDNIFYISQGLVPYRDANYNWLDVVPGNTSKTLWQPKYHPIEDLPQLLNPKSGLLYNVNFNSFKKLAEGENANTNFDPTMSVPETDNNRARRLYELLPSYASKKVSMDDLKAIRSDVTFPKNISFHPVLGLEKVFELDETKYKHISTMISALKNWDRKADKTSTGATVFTLFLSHFSKELGTQQANFHTATEKELVKALEEAQKYLQKYFGRMNVPLGEMLVHVRDNKEIPAEGCHDVLAQCNGKPYKKGKFKSFYGDTYIQYVKFSKDQLPEIESISPFGESRHADSKHNTDQMQLSADHKVKKMTLDKAIILKDAEKIYSPE